MLSKAGWSIAAAGLCFIGYCIYFDRKRRSDPNFKEKLREKRKRTRQLAKNKKMSSEMPDLKDPESVQRYFLQELHLGEDMLSMGDIETGSEHLSNAVAVCGQPQQLLDVLQQTLPAQVLQLLLIKLPTASERLILGVPEKSPPHDNALD